MNVAQGTYQNFVGRFPDKRGEFVLRAEDQANQQPDPAPTYYDVGVTSSFVRGICVFFLRGGLIMIQLACVPNTNLRRVVVQNFVDICGGIIAYCVLGFVISFGKDFAGFFGYKNWLYEKNANLNSAIFGWSCVCIATGLYSTVLAGRVNFAACLLTSCFISGVMLPLFMHWIWTPGGWMFRVKFMGNLVTYKDYGGGMVIHCSAGLVAVINCSFLGRRLLKLNELDEGSIPLGAPIYSFFGYILLMIGIMGFCIPTPRYETSHVPFNYIGLTFVNNLLSAAGGLFTVIMIEFVITRKLLPYWSVIRYLQGGIAGMVIITAGVDVYNPFIALLLGACGGIIFYFISYCTFALSAIEDYPNIIAIHLINGIIGSILPPIAGDREGFGIADKAIYHIAWQCACTLILFAASGISVVIFTLALKLFGLLQNADEKRNHQRAIAVYNQGPHPKFLGRLWPISRETHLIEPGIGTKKELYKDSETTI